MRSSPYASAGYYEPKTVLDNRRSRKDGTPQDQNVLGPSWLLADRRPQCGLYDQLIRSMSMVDGYSFLFNFMRIELLRIGPRLQKSNSNLWEHLNKAWSWPERQERSGNVTEAPRLTLPK